MDKKVYYLIKKVPNDRGFIKNLPESLIEYSSNKYKGRTLTASLYAWHLLLTVTNINFNDIEFLKNGKPIIKGYAISISHSKDCVFIAYSTDINNLGIDIEQIDLSRNLESFKNLKDFTFNSVYEFFNKWTEREAYLKTLSEKKFKNLNYTFKGITKNVTIDEKEYSWSIYADNNINFIEVNYEDYV